MAPSSSSKESAASCGIPPLNFITSNDYLALGNHGAVMNFQIPGHIMRWLGIAVVMNVFVWVVTWTPEANYALCTKTDNCLVSWVSALSGWVAAAGALIAAKMTLAPLIEQVREAKRQSDFLVGDSDPEFVLLRHRQKNTVSLRVTNWNRRNVLVDAVDCTSPDGVEVARIEAAARTNASSPPRAPYLIEGWWDRSQAPMRRNLRLSFARDGSDLTDIAAQGTAISVRIAYRVVGQQHERKVCTATAIDLAEGEE